MDGQFKIAFFCLSFFNLMLTEQVLASSSSERLALLQLRASLGIRARYWPKKVEPCFNWTGIECKDGRVTGISLSGITRTRVGKLNPRFAIDPLSKLTSLSSFNASGFPLPGPIPEWLGQRLVTLQVLDLRSCSIFGSIPESFGSLLRLSSLYLSDNSITGIIPAALGKLHSLSFLDLSGNLLTGSIPSAISALKNVTSLDLSSNFLSGAIPVEVGLLSSLGFLRLHNNSFSSSVPAQLGNLSSLVELDLSYNFLSGSLPEDLGRLRSLQKMLIGNNELEGALPVGLFFNHNLLFLDISENKFTGDLPNLTAFFNYAGAKFNFSNNLFYGNVSFEIGGNVSLDLSNNFFKGLAPASTKSNVTLRTNCFESLPDQRSIMDCRNFYAKRGLLFDSDDVPESLERPNSGPSKKKKKLTFILVGIFGGLGCIVILGLGLAYLLKKCSKRSANVREMADVGPATLKDSTPTPKTPLYFSGLGEAFTYEQMLHATNNFSETNVIKHGHSGDIFRGTLEGGNLVVIKRANLNVLQKERYTLELDLFNKLNHPRLVPLIGHCVELENEKFLVYKYMPNGDLSNSLYRVNYLDDDGLQSLDWITRLKIAIGAAEALSYLHHECNPPLVHRDIQASSILLDDEYEVRLGSLSKVCAQGANSNQNRISRMLWMSQTPDKGPSGLSSAGCAYDVYCFGKVLLGLVTGKLGICSLEDEGSTNEWLQNNLSYISTQEKELVGKIIDQSLIIDDDLLDEVWAVAIVAKSCLNPKPSRRPLMKHVLRALENPFKVVREENFNSGGLRTTSSRKYWSLAFFGSWRSSSESASFTSQTRRESTSGLKQTGRVESHGSGGNEHSSSHKRSSSEIFPEPVDIQDVEKQEEN